MAHVMVPMVLQRKMGHLTYNFVWFQLRVYCGPCIEKLCGAQELEKVCYTHLQQQMLWCSYCTPCRWRQQSSGSATCAPQEVSRWDSWPPDTTGTTSCRTCSRWTTRNMWVPKINSGVNMQISAGILHQRLEPYYGFPEVRIIMHYRQQTLDRYGQA